MTLGICAIGPKGHMQFSVDFEQLALIWEHDNFLFSKLLYFEALF